MDLIGRLHEIGVLSRGEFILKSGEKSDYYIDMRKLVSHPSILKTIVALIYHNSNKIQCIAGVPQGGIPYATYLSALYNIPMVFIRKTPKTHGKCQLVEGNIDKNIPLTLIEDVVTSGQSLLETINKVEGEGYKIKEIITIVNREQGGIEMIRQKGYNIQYIFTKTALFNRNRYSCMKFNSVQQDLINFMIRKKTNIVFSNDITDKSRFLEVLDKVGPHICVVKTHFDTIKDCDTKFFNELFFLKKKHDFLVLEDRKFSDIGSTVVKQYNNKIKKHADFVTVHSLCGSNTIECLAKEGAQMLVIAQLSCKNNLIDDKYTQKTVAIAKKYQRNIVGFVAQNKYKLSLPVSYNPFFIFTPGVHLNQSGDCMGQQYSTPENLKQNGTDFFIIGRGIYNADDPLKAVLEYKRKCWVE